jgi:hypothetical protein
MANCGVLRVLVIRGLVAFLQRLSVGIKGKKKGVTSRKIPNFFGSVDKRLSHSF